MRMAVADERRVVELIVSHLAEAGIDAHGYQDGCAVLAIAQAHGGSARIDISESQSPALGSSWSFRDDDD